MAECSKCGYQWDYSGDMEVATCPSCMQKTEVHKVVTLKTFDAMLIDAVEYAEIEDYSIEEVKEKLERHRKELEQYGFEGYEPDAFEKTG